MSKQEFERLFIEAINSLRQQVFVPYDTGNLKFNAIKGHWTAENRFTIYVDEHIAPYVYYTNGDKDLGKKMDAEIKRYQQSQKGLKYKYGNKTKGKKGLKYNWVDKMVDYIASYIANKLGGELRND